jgi:cytochrome c biogenesis protein CcmG/thiol:disulfide interchange protein DsbE
VVGVSVVVVALAIVLALNVDRDPAADTRNNRLVGKMAPELALTRLDGSKLTSRDLAGKTVLVNFWNSWCIPCRAELGTLRAFYDAHRDDPDVVLVGIPRADTNEAIRRSARDDGVAWTVADDAGARQATIDYGTTGQPETYAIGPDGVVAGAVIQQVDRAALEQLLARARGTG